MQKEIIHYFHLFFNDFDIFDDVVVEKLDYYYLF